MTFSRLVLQVALLALLCGVVGFLAGRYLWPRSARPDRPPARALAPTPAPEDLEPALSGLEERLRASESDIARLRHAVAQVSDEHDGGHP